MQQEEEEAKRKEQLEGHLRTYYTYIYWQFFVLQYFFLLKNID